MTSISLRFETCLDSILQCGLGVQDTDYAERYPLMLIRLTSARSKAVLLFLLMSVLPVPGADFTMKVTESGSLARGLISAINRVRRFPLMPAEVFMV